MEGRAAKRTNTAKHLMSHINDNSLPNINQKMTKTSKQFRPIVYRQKRTLLYSADQNKRFQLDSKKFRISINKKKEQIFSLEKKCKILKEKNKFNDEIIKEMFTTKGMGGENNNQNNNRNINPVSYRISRNKKKEEEEKKRVAEYKENKKILESVKNQYIIGKQENKKVRVEISLLDEDIKDIESKINQKKNEIINIKNKIKLTEKNKNQKKEILEINEEENKKLSEEIMKFLEKQIDSNKKKLNEKNAIIEKNTKIIEELRNKKIKLEKRIKKKVE